ncbi:MAG: phage virion morphogenesis protein [Burkholderiaceae bacterium]|nr:phage virion morphogenesis protein [Burkholderiaceae bacterium]
MTGITVEAHTVGLESLEGALLRMANLGQRPRPIWDAIGQYGESSTRLRFKKQIDPEGKRWIPSRRSQAFGPGQTLIQKARLLRSISHSSDNNGASWGTNVKYAPTHQFGAVIKPKSGGALRFKIPGVGFVTVKKVTIPARAFVGVNPEDGREIESIAAEVVYNAGRNPSQGYSVGTGGD